MRSYLSWLSLGLFMLFIVLGFIFPQVLNPLPDSWDLVLITLLLLGSFFTAFFSMKGPLKAITLVVSSISIVGVVVIVIFGITMMLSGNFGT